MRSVLYASFDASAVEKAQAKVRDFLQMAQAG